MERETTTIKTPKGGHEVIMFTYVTAGEKIALYKSGQDESLDVMLKTLIKSPSYEEVMDFHGADLDFLIQKMTAVAEESSWNEEKKV